LSLPIPKLLEYHYKNSSLLFLGCSLLDDRTVQVFRAVKEKLNKQKEFDFPQHYSIEQAPETEDELIARNAFLEKLGIAGIWFEKAQFECVEDMLRLARNELRYRGVLPRKLEDTNLATDQDPQETKSQQVKGNLILRVSKSIHQIIESII